MNNVYLKVCTTGLDASKDRIVSIDYKIDTNDEKRIIINPNSEFQYSEKLDRLNSLTKQEIIDNGIPFQEAFDICVNDIKSAKIIGHNICKCAFTFLKNELIRHSMTDKYSLLWKNTVVDIFNLTRTISPKRSMDDLCNQFLFRRPGNILNSLAEIYPIILNNITPEEKLSNELSPSGWLKVIDDKVYFAKGKYVDCNLDDVVANITESYMNFIRNNSEPHTVRCLLHYDKLKNFLKKN